MFKNNNIQNQTSDTDYNAEFMQSTGIGRIFTRFMKVALGIGAAAGIYSMTSGDTPNDGSDMAGLPIQQAVAGEAPGGGDSGATDAALNAIADTITPTSKAGQVTSAVSGVGEMVTGLLGQAQGNANAPAFYRPVITDDGIEDSFFDLSYKSIKDENGKNIGKINDILVDTQSGKAEYIIYALPGESEKANPKLSRIGYGAVMMQEKDGDIQVNLNEATLENPESTFQYTPQILGEYLSLKYLRQGQVMDAFGETVGKIMAVTYRNNGIEDVYIALDESFATGKARIFHMPFKEVSIIRDQDGFDLHLNKTQTERIARQVYASEQRQKPARPQPAAVQQ